MKIKIKAVLAIGALAALLPFGVQSVHAATATTPVAAFSSGISTPIDAVLDLAVDRMSSQLKLSTADRLVAREQMQFQYRSLTPDQQREIVTAARNINSEEAVQRVTQLLNAATRVAAEQALARFQEQNKVATGDQNAGHTKLGLTGSDLVFVRTTGPCRVADTRNNISANWPGPVNGFEARQIWAYSNSAGYNYATFQGGTGTAGSGNCTETVYSGIAPVTAVVTVTVVDLSTPGSLIAWDGTPALTVGSALAWNPGDRLANTTVVALDRAGAQFPNSGPYKRDFGVYNNSSTPINVVADVVGYFIVSEATALECTSVAGTMTPIGPGATTFISGPSCPTGYTAIAALPDTAGQFGLYAGTIYSSGCRLNNTTGGTLSGTCSTRCCRLPGR